MTLNEPATMALPAGGPGTIYARRRWWALAVLALVQFMILMDITVVNVALPSIQHALVFSATGLAWVVNGYTLTAGGLLLLGGRLADLFSRRRQFVIGVVLFAAASLAAGLARNPAMLVSARFAQGAGEAIASPAALSLLALLFTDRAERTRALTIWGALAGLGGTIGVVLSGVITDLLSWRWIFFINLPIALLALVFLPRVVAADPPGSGARSALGRLDLPGAILVTSGLVAVVDGLLAAGTHSWGDIHVLLPIAAGVLLLTGFVAVEARVRHPLAPLSFFRNRTRVSSNLAQVLFGGAFTAMYFLLTLYMQDVRGYSPLRAGLAYVPLGFALVAGVGVTNALLGRLGAKIMSSVGFVVAAGGLALLSGIGPGTGYLAHILPGTLVFGLGAGVTFPALQNAALDGADELDAGLASGVYSTFQQIGSSLGLAVLVSLATTRLAHAIHTGTALSVATTDAYALAFTVAAAVLAAGAVAVALAMPRPGRLAPHAADQ
jgi:EmrB/QacA subfamily drug resistance transporter